MLVTMLLLSKEGKRTSSQNLDLCQYQAAVIRAALFRGSFTVFRGSRAGLEFVICLFQSPEWWDFSYGFL